MEPKKTNLEQVIENIKTIGDAYMAAGGLPTAKKMPAEDVIQGATEVRRVLHTGPLVAGMVGVKKFIYNIRGETVNMSNRMKTSSQEGKVNVSQSTYACISDDPNYTFEYRGEIGVKGKSEVQMWFVDQSQETKYGV